MGNESNKEEEWIDVPTFNGINLDLWISEMEELMMRYQVPEVQFVNFAHVYVEGNARAWVGLHYDAVCGMNWSEFIDELRAEFEQILATPESVSEKEKEPACIEAGGSNETRHMSGKEEDEQTGTISSIKVHDLSGFTHNSYLDIVFALKKNCANVRYDSAIHVPCNEWLLMFHALNMFHEMLRRDLLYSWSISPDEFDFVDLLLDREGLNKLKPPILWHKSAECGRSLWQHGILLTMAMNMLDKVHGKGYMYISFNFHRKSGFDNYAEQYEELLVDASVENDTVGNVGDVELASSYANTEQEEAVDTVDEGCVVELQLSNSTSYKGIYHIVGFGSVVHCRYKFLMTRKIKAWLVTFLDTLAKVCNCGGALGYQWSLTSLGPSMASGWKQAGAKGADLFILYLSTHTSRKMVYPGGGESQLAYSHENHTAYNFVVSAYSCCYKQMASSISLQSQKGNTFVSVQLGHLLFLWDPSPWILQGQLDSTWDYSGHVLQRNVIASGWSCYSVFWGDFKLLSSIISKCKKSISHGDHWCYDSGVSGIRLESPEKDRYLLYRENSVAFIRRAYTISEEGYLLLYDISATMVFQSLSCNVDIIRHVVAHGWSLCLLITGAVYFSLYPTYDGIQNLCSISQMQNFTCKLQWVCYINIGEPSMPLLFISAGVCLQLFNSIFNDAVPKVEYLKYAAGRLFPLYIFYQPELGQALWLRLALYPGGYPIYNIRVIVSLLSSSLDCPLQLVSHSVQLLAAWSTSTQAIFVKWILTHMFSSISNLSVPRRPVAPIFQWNIAWMIICKFGTVACGGIFMFRYLNTELFAAGGLLVDYLWIHYVDVHFCGGLLLLLTVVADLMESMGSIISSIASNEVIVAQVLYLMVLTAGRQIHHTISLTNTNKSAIQLEAEERMDRVQATMNNLSIGSHLIEWFDKFPLCTRYISCFDPGIFVPLFFMIRVHWGRLIKIADPLDNDVQILFCQSGYIVEKDTSFVVPCGSHSEIYTDLHDDCDSIGPPNVCANDVEDTTWQCNWTCTFLSSAYDMFLPNLVVVLSGAKLSLRSYSSESELLHSFCASPTRKQNVYFPIKSSRRTVIGASPSNMLYEKILTVRVLWGADVLVRVSTFLQGSLIGWVLGFANLLVRDQSYPVSFGTLVDQLWRIAWTECMQVLILIALEDKDAFKDWGLS